MASGYILRINKQIIESSVSFDCENNEDLIGMNIVADNDYAEIKVKENAVVTYTISCKGYETLTNTLSVTKDITLTPELKKLVTLTIIADPNDAEIIFEYQNKTYKQSSIDVLTSIPVKYTVQKRNMQSVSDTIILERDTTLNISLNKSIKSDEDISKYEGENSDFLSSIHAINQDEYSRLPDDIRAKYVKYTDLVSRFLGVDYSLTLNDCIVQLYWMLPIVQKLTPFTNGTLGSFQSDFIVYLAQLNTLFAAGEGVKDQLDDIKKALNKVGLGKITDIFTVAFGLIGGLAGIVYGILNNPDIFIKTYYQAFQDIDLQEIYDRTIKKTIPDVEYVKGMLNRTYIPEGNLKKNLFDRIDQISEAADFSLDVLGDLSMLKSIVDTANTTEDGMKTLIEHLSTFSLQWALGSLSDSISRLKLDKDKMKYNLNNNQLAEAYEIMRNNLDKMRQEENYYIHEDDLSKLNMSYNTNNTQELMDYDNGYKDAYENGQNGETEEEKDRRLAKIKAEMEKLGQDPSGYLYGYNIGWAAGNNIYNLKDLHLTEEQEKSYNNGYQDGYNFRTIITELAEDSKEIGYLEWFLDVDNHIHNASYGNSLIPYGRIEPGIVYAYSGNKIGKVSIKTDKIFNLENSKELGYVGTNIDLPINDDHEVIGYIDGNIVYNFNGYKIGEIQEDNTIIDENHNIIGNKKNVYYALSNDKNIIGYVDEKGIVYDFNEDMTENVIGSFDFQTSKIYIRDENKYYLLVSAMYIYDTDEDETRSVESLISLIHNFNKMRVERNAPIGNLNPYYASGWKDGYNDKIIKENNEKKLLKQQEYGVNGYHQGYPDEIIGGYPSASDDKTFEECNTIIQEQQVKYEEQGHPEYFSYYKKGFHMGYNQYQTEYNMTYNRGWFAEDSISSYEFYYPTNEYIILEDFGYIYYRFYEAKKYKVFEKNYNGTYKPFGYIKDGLCYDWNDNYLGTYLKDGNDYYYVTNDNQRVAIAYAELDGRVFVDSNGSSKGFIFDYHGQTDVIQKGFYTSTDVIFENVGTYYASRPIVLDLERKIIGEIKDNLIYYYDTEIIKAKFNKDEAIIPYTVYDKEEFLQQIITDYHLENLTPSELEKNGYYRGANQGWDDKSSGLENPVFRKYFY